MSTQPVTGAGDPAGDTPAAEANGTATSEANGAAAGGANGTATSEANAAASGASRTTDVTAGPGGVMTDEVGVVTGELTLRTEFDGGQVTLRVQYKEAAEWYTVTGGRAPLPTESGLDAVHTIAVGLLHRPEG